jgi:glycosyltransferase involved in cell wall biosynthesis
VGNGLHVIQTVDSLALNAGGPTQTVTSLSYEIARSGVSVDVLSRCADHQFLINHSDRGVLDLIFHGSSSLNPTHNFDPLAVQFRRLVLSRTVQHSKNVVLHDNGVWLPSNHVVASVARRSRIPLVVSTHGMLEPWAFNHRRLKKILAWVGYQRRDLYSASLLHATAEQEFNGLRSLGIRVPIAIIPHGVSPPLCLRPNLRESRRSGSAVRTALFLSRIHPKKGVENLLRAWAVLKPGGWHLKIAGPDEGGYRRKIEDLSKELGLQACVEFTGAVVGEAKDQLFREADLFILPTFSENFGVVVVEALTHGLPVITTQGTPWADIEKFNCGWWIEVGIDPLVRAIKEAIDLSDFERVKMGINGIEYVRRYDWGQTGQNMIAAYGWILGHRDKPDFVHL